MKVAATFNFDEKTMNTINALMNHFNVESKGSIIQKAITLLDLASRNEQSDGTLVIKTSDGKDLKIVMKK